MRIDLRKPALPQFLSMSRALIPGLKGAENMTLRELDQVLELYDSLEQIGPVKVFSLLGLAALQGIQVAKILGKLYGRLGF